MLKFFTLLPAVVVMLVTSLASAQHSDLFVYQADGALVPTDGSQETVVFSRLFDFFGHIFGDVSRPKAFAANDPGFQSNNSPIQGTTVLPPGELLTVNFLPFQLPGGGGESGNLLHWQPDGGPVDFGPVPDGHFFEISGNGSGNSDDNRIDGSDSRLSGIVVNEIDTFNGLHDHINWRLDDGDSDSATDPQPGIYLMVATLSLNGLDDSTPIAFLLNSTDISFADQTLATEWVESQLSDFSLSAGLTGDFDNNGALELNDIDALSLEIIGDSNDPTFDMNGDGQIDIADVLDADSGWLAVAGAENSATTGGNPFLLGDIDLNGQVDSTDLGRLLNNFSDLTGRPYSAGNLNADAAIDSTDLGQLLNNFAGQAASVSVVPEPSMGALLLIGAVLILNLRRQFSQSPKEQLPT